MAQVGKFEMLNRSIGKKQEIKLITPANDKIVKRR